MTFTPDYSRQLSLNGMGEAQQQQLYQSTVLVFGAGGLGVTALSYLAAAGVGRITVVDPDCLEPSNLHRQTIYQTTDVGKLKVDVAALYLAKRNPLCEIKTISKIPDLSDLHQLCTGHDIVLDCTDDTSFSYLLNSLCLVTKTICVFANAVGLEGQLFALHPHQSEPCYNCLWPRGQSQGDSCNQVGVLGPVPGILGCLQALESIKILTGQKNSLLGELLYCDFSHYRFSSIRIPKSEHCCHHLTLEDIRQSEESSLTPNVVSIADINHRDWIIIDIRSGLEIAENPCPMEHLHLEAHGLLSNPTLHLSRQNQYLIVCATGKRSTQICSTLRREGFLASPAKIN